MGPCTPGPHIQLSYYTTMALTAEIGTPEAQPNAFTSSYPGAPPDGAVPVEGYVVPINFTHVRPDPRAYPLDLSFVPHAWRSTGLYAAPGAVVNVTFPPELAASGLLRLQVSGKGHHVWVR